MLCSCDLVEEDFQDINKKWNMKFQIFDDFFFLIPILSYITALAGHVDDANPSSVEEYSQGR